MQNEAIKPLQVRLLRPAWCYIVHKVPDGHGVALCGKRPAARATGSGWYLVREGRQLRVCETCTAIEAKTNRELGVPDVTAAR
jgi:hypothetical protein